MGYENFERLCKEHNVTPSKVAQETGISTATLSNWKYNRYIPKDDKRRKIADYFGVSLEYLDGTPSKTSDISDVYLSLAKDLQDSEIDPHDIKIMIETIKKYRK